PRCRIGSVRPAEHVGDVGRPQAPVPEPSGRVRVVRLVDGIPFGDLPSEMTHHPGDVVMEKLADLRRREPAAPPVLVEPRGNRAMPDKRVPADLEPMLLRPADHPVGAVEVKSY